MINAAYYDKPLIFTRASFLEKLVSYHRAVNATGFKYSTNIYFLYFLLRLFIIIVLSPGVTNIVLALSNPIYVNILAKSIFLNLQGFPTSLLFQKCRLTNVQADAVLSALKSQNPDYKMEFPSTETNGAELVSPLLQSLQVPANPSLENISVLPDLNLEDLPKLFNQQLENEINGNPCFVYNFSACQKLVKHCHQFEQNSPNCFHWYCFPCYEPKDSKFFNFPLTTCY